MKRFFGSHAAHHHHSPASSTFNFNAVTKSSLLDSKDYKWVGQYVKAVTLAPHSEIGSHPAQIDEYFRKSFRKLTSRQAYEILQPLGDNTEEKAACLDSSFWTWETLEEAIRGDLD